jgi:hypothetical protein
LLIVPPWWSVLLLAFGWCVFDGQVYRRNMRSAGISGRGEIIVALSADLGEKYLEAIYDPTWVAKVIAADGDKSARAHAFVAAEGNAQSTDDSCARRELVEPVRRNRQGLSGE